MTILLELPQELERAVRRRAHASGPQRWVYEYIVVLEDIGRAVVGKYRIRSKKMRLLTEVVYGPEA